MLNFIKRLLFLPVIVSIILTWLLYFITLALPIWITTGKYGMEELISWLEDTTNNACDWLEPD